MEIPTYKDALARHETPLDIFVARWQPVDSIAWGKSFREDLEAVLNFVMAQQEQHIHAALQDIIEMCDIGDEHGQSAD